MTAKDITLDLIIRYGFQILGAMIILIVGVLLARWSRTSPIEASKLG